MGEMNAITFALRNGGADGPLLLARVSAFAHILGGPRDLTGAIATSTRTGVADILNILIA
jgi:hypothetical protein